MSGKGEDIPMEEQEGEGEKEEGEESMVASSAVASVPQTPASGEEEGMGEMQDDSERAQEISRALEQIADDMQAFRDRNADINLGTSTDLTEIRTLASGDVKMGEARGLDAESVFADAQSEAKDLVRSHIQMAIAEADKMIADENTRRQAIEDLMGRIQQQFDQALRPKILEAEKTLNAELPKIKATETEAIRQKIAKVELENAEKRNEIAQQATEKLLNTHQKTMDKQVANTRLVLSRDESKLARVERELDDVIAQKQQEEENLVKAREEAEETLKYLRKKRQTFTSAVEEGDPTEQKRSRFGEMGD